MLLCRTQRMSGRPRAFRIFKERTVAIFSGSMTDDILRGTLDTDVLWGGIGGDTLQGGGRVFA